MSKNIQTSTRKRPWTPSKTEEVIAIGWTIIFLILLQLKAPPLIVWCAGVKAASDHLTAIIYAVRELKTETWRV